jgi:translation elongation factor P/translation initiation factor 5A
MNKREAAIHSSAENYREQARLARRSFEFENDEDERTKFLDLARHYEQLATSLENMRAKHRPMLVSRQGR